MNDGHKEQEEKGCEVAVEAGSNEHLCRVRNKGKILYTDSNTGKKS